nr:MAG TPA: hypothetical protein [Caudoviricetes sp.]
MLAIRAHLPPWQARENLTLHDANAIIRALEEQDAALEE